MTTTHTLDIVGLVPRLRLAPSTPIIAGASLLSLAGCSGFAGVRDTDATAPADLSALDTSVSIDTAGDALSEDTADSASRLDASDASDAAVDASGGRWFCDDGGRCSTQRSCPDPAERGCGVHELARSEDFSIGSAQAINGLPVMSPILVSAFAIDMYEVTVARFRRFANAGYPLVPGASVAYPRMQSTEVAYAPMPPTFRSAVAECNFTPSPVGREEHPVNCVDWATAQAFCVWDGGRLPSETEWELGARTLEQTKFPWGTDEHPDMQLCWSGRMTTMRTGTCPVGDFRSGHGLYDMVGNVWELTADQWDLYGGTCWPTDRTFQDPLCSGGTARMYTIRGGDYGTTAERAVTTASRMSILARAHFSGVGFRCARPVPGPRPMP